MSELLMSCAKKGEAIQSLRVTRPDYCYPPFRQPLTKAERRELDGMIDIGTTFSVPFVETFSRYTPMYVCSVIESVENGEDPDKSLERLAALRDMCKVELPVISERVNGWLFDLCLSKGLTDRAYLLCQGASHTAFLERDYKIGLAMSDVLGSYNAETDSHIIGAISAVSAYNYTESRYYKGNEETFRAAMCASVYALLREMCGEEDSVFSKIGARTVKRYAFAGLPCSSEYARVFEITYIPYSEEASLSEIITAAVQYTENLVRQGLGIRVKLPGQALSAEYRKVCAEAVREELPGFLPPPAKVGRKPKLRDGTVKKTAGKENAADKCEVFDLNVDFSRAKQLEAESWRLASMLGGDYGTSDISLTFEESSDAKVELSFERSDGNSKCDDGAYDSADTSSIHGSIPEEWKEFFECLSESETAFIRCIALGEDTDALARSLGEMALGIANSVNEKASDTYGDIIIDTSGTALSFFEDYKDELYGIITSVKGADNG